MKLFKKVVVLFVCLSLLAVNVQAHTLDENSITNTKNYTFEVTQTGLFTITIEDDSEFLNPRYALYNKTTGQLIDYIFIYNGSAVATFGLTPDIYELKIVKESENPTADHISISTSFEPAETYDLYGHHSMETAVAIPKNTVIKGNYSSVYVYSDYYKFEITEPTKLSIDLIKDTQLSILNADGEVVSSTQAEVNLKAGTYYIVASGSNYSFVYNLLPVEQSFEYEPNNNFDKAENIELNSTIMGFGNTYTDEDFYSFVMPETGFATFYLNRITNLYNKSVYFVLYDANGKEQYSFYENEEFTLGLKAGNYTIAVHPVYGEEYSLSFKKVEAHPNPNIEFNDFHENAQRLEINTKLRSIPLSHFSDVNMYEIDIPEDGYTNIHIDADNETLMEIGVYTKEGKFVSSLETVKKDNEKTFDFYVGLAKGQYVIKSRLFYATPYTISYHVDSEVKAEIEENGSLVEATPIQLNSTLLGNISYSLDEDFYMLTLDKDQTIEWTIEGEANNNLSVELFEENSKDGEVVWYERSFNRATYTKHLTKGTYYFKVYAHFYKKVPGYKINVKEVNNLFSDVSPNYKYFEEIMNIRAKGIINGYPDGTFKPSAPMQRQHVAAMIARSNAPTIPSAISYYNFPDVKKTHAFYNEINKLVTAGIIAKDPNGFRPNDTITRAEMAKILVLAYNLENKEGSRIYFKDVPENAWYAEYVQILAQNGIALGYNGSFNPNEKLTREHFCIFLSRVLN